MPRPTKKTPTPPATNHDKFMRHRGCIQMLASLNWTPKEVAQQTGLSMQLVSKWFSCDTVGDEGRSGRPKTAGATGDATMGTTISKHMRGRRFASTRKEVVKLRALGVKTTRWTIMRRLKEMGLKARRSNKKLLLVKRHRALRVSFAKTWRGLDWTRVLFTDEKTFYINTAPNRHNDVIWVMDGDELPPQGKYVAGTGINVWGGVCAHGKASLQFLEGKQTATTYTKVLRKMVKNDIDELYPDGEWVLLQDNAPIHTANVVKTYLDNSPKIHSYFTKRAFPPYSPDLNLIENIWAVMQEQVAQKGPTTKAQLKQEIVKAWKAIKDDHLHTLVASMPERLTEVLASKGAMTKH
jgi:transposase